MIIAVNFLIKQIGKKRPEKIRASTGFEPVKYSFIAQLVEHRTGIVEVTGSNPDEALIFSGFSFPIA